MSLTSFIEKNSDVRKKISQEFPKTPLRVKKDLLAPPLTKNYSTIGTAFDYLLRFYVKYLNKNTLDKKYWIADTSLLCLTDYPELHRKAQQIILRAREEEREFLKTGEITNQLIESVISLAYLDPIFRARRGHDYIGVPIDEQDIQDVRNLISIVDPTCFRSEQLCLLNPTFGASGLVGGADADLVIGDHLIEIKTTKNLELRLRQFQQLIGYYTLYYLDGLTGVEYQPIINKISIYFSRHAYFYTLQVEDLINQETFPTFVDWFKKRAMAQSIYPRLRRASENEEILSTSYLSILLEVPPATINSHTSFRQYGFVLSKIESDEQEAKWRIDRVIKPETPSLPGVTSASEQKATVTNQVQSQGIVLSPKQGLTRKQFAEYHSIPVSTVRDWMKKGLSNFKPAKRKYREILAEWYFQFDEDSNKRLWYKRDS